MPIYEYQCSKCEHRLEALQKISDAPLSECPECHEQSLKKLVSAASFRLKGGGWYETDFKKEGRKQLAESDSGDSGNAKSSAEAGAAKTDSKGGKASKETGKQGDSKPGAAASNPAPSGDK
jgi:putative FmdB family regulatory protein